MRIVGGEFRGVRISVPKNFRARPTTDMAKESLFNILANKIDFEELIALDLFGGTGGIALEFASRGASKVVTVERNYIHLKHIIKSIEKLKLQEVVKPIKSDVFLYLNSCKSKFDLVFADPPYDLKDLDKIPEKIFAANVLNNGGLLVLEHPGNYLFNAVEGFVNMRKYGSVHFSFFEKK